MSRRLEEATEDVLLVGGRAGRKAIEEAGFESDFKEIFLAEVAHAQFCAANNEAFAPAAMGQIEGSRTMAASALASSFPWTGEDKTEDAVLRMLSDSRKPLVPSLRGRPKDSLTAVVDLRIYKEPARSAGQKLASARERATAYTSIVLGKNLDGKTRAAFSATASPNAPTPKERAALRQEHRERFEPGARAVMPGTSTGLAMLENKRIEDAIARGQFRNIPRGKGVESGDARAENPFIDTTEYIMNRMILRQELVPPWIEKQRELRRDAARFRTRLRLDWKRHAARKIASSGGSLKQQMELANAYAQAEEVYRQRRTDVDDVGGSTNPTDDLGMVAMRQQNAHHQAAQEPSALAYVPEIDPPPTAARPFRDAEWEATERSYHELALQSLNTLTRSYNLAAPELAKKPYLSLSRELSSCYADVAPQLAETIRERASRPPAHEMPRDVEDPRERKGLLQWMTGDTVKIYDSKAPHYGLSEFWRDLWRKAGA